MVGGSSIPSGRPRGRHFGASLFVLTIGPKIWYSRCMTDNDKGEMLAEWATGPLSAPPSLKQTTFIWVCLIFGIIAICLVR